VGVKMQAEFKIEDGKLYLELHARRAVDCFLAGVLMVRFEQGRLTMQVREGRTVRLAERERGEQDLTALLLRGCIVGWDTGAEESTRPPERAD
jgi:hypothetical protein